MIRPLRDHVLVKPIPRKQSNTLIVVSSEKFNIGTVEAVGPGLITKRGIQPCCVAVGDQIRYGNGDYLDWPIIHHEGQEFQMIREADIAGIIEEDNA